MKAVIACAGRGVRLYPITLDTPKPLIPILGKSIINYTLDGLQNIVDEVIVVVSEANKSIINADLAQRGNMKCTFVIQHDISGTASALIAAKEFLGDDDFIYINGDDLHSKDNIKKVSEYPSAIIGKYVQDPSTFGVIRTDDRHKVLDIVEKPQTFVGHCANIGMYHLPAKVFDYIDSIEKSPRGEYELPSLINEYCKENEMICIETKNEWIPMQYPWDILTALERKLPHMKEKIEGIIEDGVTIKGKLSLGKGSIIMKGVYIEGDVYIGENVTIRQNAFLRGPLQIGDNSVIGYSCEVKNSYVGRHTWITHLSFIGDSVLMDNINIGGGTITANFRFDEETVKVLVSGTLVDTKRQKLGVIIGNNVKVGIQTSFMPGVMVYPHAFVEPGQMVKRNVIKY